MPNYLQRKQGHDYSDRGIYLITATTTDRLPLLGTLVGSIEDAQVESTPIGKAVIAAFLDIERQMFSRTGCKVQVLQYQLMPDHFHGILFIQDQLPLKWNLGRIIRGWKVASTHAYWQEQADDGGKAAGENNLAQDNETPNPSSPYRRLFSDVDNVNHPPLFTHGYNDRPLVEKGQLQVWINYLHDNPHRLALKRANPDLFRIYTSLQHGNLSFRALGNRFLLDYPERKVVQCSRHMTQEEIDRKRDECLYEAALGTIFVSAAISEGERQICRAIRETGGRLIILLEKGFPQPDDPRYKYFKPQGVYFEACAAGKMLLLDFEDEQLDHSSIEAKVTSKAGNIPHDSLRYRFLALNGIAEEICTQRN